MSKPQKSRFSKMSKFLKTFDFLSIFMLSLSQLMKNIKDLIL